MPPDGSAPAAPFSAAVAPSSSGAYRGRFAPSPTGPLHAGSLVAALASWLDARVHGGRWLVRIEDVDAARCSEATGHFILTQLAACGLQPDEPPVWQSSRHAAYAGALETLKFAGRAYPCGCTRKDIESANASRGRPHVPGLPRPYPGTCRSGLKGKAPRAWRLLVSGRVAWEDRRLGAAAQDLDRDCGDFVLLRADGYWAYPLAVVVDDAAQGITHVVRGEDLSDQTPGQIALHRALSLSLPAYLHTPLVMARDGRKLSKQNGAEAFDRGRPLAALKAAGRVLGLPDDDRTHLPSWLDAAVQAWAGIITGFANRTRPMTTNPSGLQYEDTTVGAGAEAAAGQNVRVHYTGWLYDPTAKLSRGTKFDSSKDRGQPFAFGLGGGQVIRGWDEGVQGMKVGGTRVLTIPPEMGYGARGAGGVIPPNATLVFEVELVSV